VVLEVVVGVGDEDGEEHPRPELVELGAHVLAEGADRVCDLGAGPRPAPRRPSAVRGENTGYATL
jgi:hypothetical protein